MQLGRSWFGDDSVTVYKKSVQETIPASTTLTFKGVAVGTTYVTIDNVKYTIQVTQENLEGKTLPMQLWFTNCDIEAPGSGYDSRQTSGEFLGSSWPQNKQPYYINVAAADAYGENGVPLTSVLPATMTRYEYSSTYWSAAKDNKAPKELVLWSGRVHNSNNIQLIAGKDYSNSGSEFQYVRYYNGKWAVSVDRTNWTNVTGEGSTVSDSSCKEQLAVYYMMRSQITKEVSTDVADWGYVNTDTDTQYTTQINTNQYVMLDFSVKYQDNTRNPSTFPQDGKTFVFHCTPNDGSGAVKRDSSGNYYRQLNNFRGMNTGDYEIYMITVTMTDGSASNTIADTTSYTYDYTNTEQIVWAIDEATKDKSGLDPYTSISGSSSNYSGCKIGGDPYVRGVEVYNQHGALITYYVRAKITTDALQVHYVNQTTGYEFYNYPIVVNSGTYFDTGFAYDQESGSLRGNTVTNSLGVKQTIESDLASIPEIGAQYRYGNYKFVDATRTDDKNVTLYYTFNTTKKFVVDFGLPLKIRPQDIAPKLANAQLTKVVVGDSQYADITHDDQLNIIYKLKTAINGQDDITVTYYGTPGGEVINNATYTVSVIPATSVYYEDSFATFTNADKSNGVDQKPGNGYWTTAGTTVTDAKQALEALGSKENVYGYDDAYANCNTFSMGSAHKVTVNADMVKGWTDSSAWPSATFTFNGTGFDVISLTDNKSGAIFVDVYAGKEATGTPVKQLTVNNYYGYKQQDGNGKWVVDADSSNALYQIPVMKVSGLDYSEYTAVIRVAYSKFFDTANKNQYSFWLDAIRVYDPMGKDKEAYTQDNEGYPQYIKLRDQLAKENGPVTTNNNLLFIDGADKAAIATYANYGPNNEVYLAKDQAIAFKVPKDTNIASIQIGAKAPNGSAAQMVVNKGTPMDIQSATEMYYKIDTDDGIFTITNTGTGILSLTNLKITYTASGKSVSLAPLTTADQEHAVAQVRALFAAPAEPFQPDRFEASWGHAVRKGDTATLTVKTSEDVDSITVDGQTITAYATKTERTGWGWWAKTVTYREFTYQVAAEETTDYTICAVNSAGVSSDPITATLTVRPSVRDWWHGIFDKWF